MLHDEKFGIDCGVTLIVPGIRPCDEIPFQEALEQRCIRYCRDQQSLLFVLCYAADGQCFCEDATCATCHAVRLLDSLFGLKTV